MKKIITCNNCELYKNQLPLLQNNTSPSNVIFVGLSAVKTENTNKDEPFSLFTRSGELLREIMSESPNSCVYFTNIVKCLPLNKDKIRYPDEEEISACLPNFDIELDIISPKKIILLGKKVSSSVSKKYGLKFKKTGEPYNFPITKYKNIEFMDAYHPSYMLVYKRKDISFYKDTILAFIQN